LSAAFLPLARPAAAAPVRAAGLAPLPTFTGPAAGVPVVTSPQGTDFVYQCNAAANPAAAQAAGATLAIGAAVQAQHGCGQSLLFLNTPASGHFTANFAVSDSDPAGTTGALRVFVLGVNGATLRTLDLTATKGKAQPVDLDVTGALTLALTFPAANTATAYVYDMHLTGAARARRATPLPGGADTPSSASPVPASSITPFCNARPLQTAASVSALTLPTAGVFEMDGCGKFTIRVPANAQGTLALRLGTIDTTPFTSLPTLVGLRVLDAGNQLLRKAVVLTQLGSGLQLLWVDIKGGSTVTLEMDGGSPLERLAITGFSMLPGSFAPHPNPDHVTFSSGAGAATPIPANGVIGDCQATLGTDDVTVDHQPVDKGDYIALNACGTAQLIMTNTHGTLQGYVGVDDSDSGHKDLTVTVVVLDRNSRPLSTTSVTAHYGSPAVRFSTSIDNASIVQIHTDSQVLGRLFGMTLKGHAVVYDQIFPPTEPPVSTSGGTPLAGKSFTTICNASVPTQDTLLIHEAALESWTLVGKSCGVASLDLAKYHGRTFSARYGLQAIDQDKVALAHVDIAVLDAGGKVLRDTTYVARAGYGPQRLAIDLNGGAKLQIKWADSTMVLFALTIV
jgi:hypothetical protein